MQPLPQFCQTTSGFAKCGSSRINCRNGDYRLQPFKYGPSQRVISGIPPCRPPSPWKWDQASKCSAFFSNRHMFQKTCVDCNKTVSAPGLFAPRIVFPWKFASRTVPPQINLPRGISSLPPGFSSLGMLPPEFSPPRKFDFLAMPLAGHPPPRK